VVLQRAGEIHQVHPKGREFGHVVIVKPVLRTIHPKLLKLEGSQNPILALGIDGEETGVEVVHRAPDVLV
jgi:hypothetical protein